MLRFILISLAVVLTHVPAHAQSPYHAGRAYGTLSAFTTTPFLASLETDGSFAVFELDNPNFNGFHGVEWDIPRQRVVFIADVNGDRSLGSVDETFDPGSTSVLLTGLGADASQVDVDPETGEIYWWEGGQIKSVGPQGGGTATVVADNVPEPGALEIDFERGVYLGFNFFQNELFSGPLDPAGTPTTFDVLAANVWDIAIDPATGDFVWTEYGTGTSGFISVVVRSSNSFGSAEAIIGNITQSIEYLDRFVGVGVIGTTVMVVRQDAVNTSSVETRVYDTTTGTYETRPNGLSTMDIEYFIDPVVSHPETLIVDEGDTAVLEVGSLDDQSVYQWLKDGTPIADDGRVGGTTTSKITFIPAEPGDTAEYSCMVTNSAGEMQISNTAILAVRGDGVPDCPADQNFDGMLSPTDFTAWIGNYNAGCP